MKTYTIISNASGTRSIDITESHLEAIRKHDLFKNLVSSNGIVDETVLDHLRMVARALIDSAGADDVSLVTFYKDVLAHPNMKSVALRNLMELYTEYVDRLPADDEKGV